MKGASSKNCDAEDDWYPVEIIYEKDVDDDTCIRRGRSGNCNERRGWTTKKTGLNGDLNQKAHGATIYLCCAC